MSEEARAELQAWVDEVGLEFEAAVSRGRGVPKARVVEWSQLGLPPRGKRAISLGLADKVGTFEGVLGKLTKARQATLAARAATDRLDLLTACDAPDAPIESDAALEPEPQPITGDLPDCSSPQPSDQAQADADAIAVAMVLGG